MTEPTQTRYGRTCVAILFLARLASACTPGKAEQGDEKRDASVVDSPSDSAAASDGGSDVPETTHVPQQVGPVVQTDAASAASDGDAAAEGTSVAGKCVAGVMRCTIAGNSQKCTADGEWGAETVCGPNEVCGLTGGCEVDTKTIVGRTGVTDATNIGIGETTIASPVYVTEPMLLEALGVQTAGELTDMQGHTEPASVGGKIKVALYDSETGVVVPRPGKLLTTGVVEKRLESGHILNLQKSQQRTMLAANTLYWVVIKFVPSGDDVRIYDYASGLPDMWDGWKGTVYVTGSLPYAAPFPEQFPGAASRHGRQRSLVLRGSPIQKKH